MALCCPHWQNRSVFLAPHRALLMSGVCATAGTCERVWLCQHAVAAHANQNDSRKRFTQVFLADFYGYGFYSARLRMRARETREFLEAHSPPIYGPRENAAGGGMPA